MSKKDFNQFRFEGFKQVKESNKYMIMNRVSADETKVIVAVGENHLIKTKYGYALVLDINHVVFVKDWQVDQNYFSNEVLIDQKYFNVKEWGEHELFCENDDALSFDYWLSAAKQQQEADNLAKWRK